MPAIVMMVFVMAVIMTSTDDEDCGVDDSDDESPFSS